MIIMTRKRFEEELDKAAQKARVEEWKTQRLDDLSNDISNMTEKIKELEGKVDCIHNDHQVIWRRIDDIQNELTRIPKCD